jgi:hypothetical protein
LNEKKPTVFDDLLVECVEETIGEVLGEAVSEAFMHHLYAYLGITPDEIPNHVSDLFSTLRNSFGVGGDTIGRRIVRKLYHKAEVPFTEVPERALADYVEELRKRWAKTHSD